MNCQISQAPKPHVKCLKAGGQGPVLSMDHLITENNPIKLLASAYREHPLYSCAVDMIQVRSLSETGSLEVPILHALVDGVYQKMGNFYSEIHFSKELNENVFCLVTAQLEKFIYLLGQQIKDTFCFHERIRSSGNRVRTLFIEKCSASSHDTPRIEKMVSVPEMKKKPKTKRSNYSKTVSGILRNWLEHNTNNPYPTEVEKAALCASTGLDPTQINNWFINARRRILPSLVKKE